MRAHVDVGRDECLRRRCVRCERWRRRRHHPDAQVHCQEDDGTCQSREQQCGSQTDLSPRNRTGIGCRTPTTRRFVNVQGERPLDLSALHVNLTASFPPGAITQRRTDTGALLNWMSNPIQQCSPDVPPGWKRSFQPGGTLSKMLQRAGLFTVSGEMRGEMYPGYEPGYLDSISLSHGWISPPSRMRVILFASTMRRNSFTTAGAFAGSRP